MIAETGGDAVIAHPGVSLKNRENEVAVLSSGLLEEIKQTAV